MQEHSFSGDWMPLRNGVRAEEGMAVVHVGNKTNTIGLFSDEFVRSLRGIESKGEHLLVAHRHVLPEEGVVATQK